ncbi:MAG: hypothetical protein DHS20C18_22760 [Saprospiraceae bacterium]|nr:MAG: hypothetical protein DHS20C18_22760 [Saprospiraceae bacterium]
MSFANVIDLFRATALKYPLATAVSTPDQTCTYQDLDRETDTLAAHLTQFGAERGELCFVFVSSPLASVKSLLSIFKAGKIYVPISLDFQDQAIGDLLQEYKPDWVILDQSTLKRFGKISQELTDTQFKTCFFDLADIAEQTIIKCGSFISCHSAVEEACLEQIVLAPEDPCYIYFTSGTSGKPKGILGAFKGIDHFIDWEINFLNLGASVRVSQFTSPTFDAFLRDLFVPICSGGTLCIPPKVGGVLKLEDLLSWIKDQKINLIHCVPSLFRELINLGESPTELPDLQYVLLSGERLFGEDVKSWCSAYGKQVKLVNLYGPSETTMIKFAYPVDLSAPLPEAIPIGQPISGCKAILLDGELRPVKAGNVGEIYLRTSYRTLGYYKNETLTKKAFVRHPLAKSDDDLLYKTGDLAIKGIDGNYHFKGRKDLQVKINGIRVELEAIESILQGLPELEDAVVLYDESSSMLAACLKTKVPAESAYFREILALKLPAYMVPGFFTFMDQFPKNSNGKTNRNKLAETVQQLIKEQNIQYIAPRNQTETALVEIWERLLKREKVGILDNFFEIGGHSLMAIRVVAQIRKTLGIEITIKDVFNYPTIETLAGILISPTDEEALPAIEVVKNRPERIPLSYSQERLWFVDQLGGSVEYHMPYVQTFGRDLNPEALEYALKTLVERHEILRTRIREEAGIAYQEIMPADNWQWSIEKIKSSGIPTDWDTLISKEINRPFDLKKDYTLRAKLFQIEDNGYVFVLVMHHIASDGWSTGIALSEILELYQSYATNRPARLAALEIQYADFTLWQRNHLNNEILEKKIDYWEERLKGIEPLNLTLDYLRPQQQSVRGEAYSFELNPDLTASLYALAKTHGATLYMLLLAAFKVLLSKYSGQSDICVGSPIANREQKELEGLIGFFANTIALRSNLENNPSFIEFLAQIKQETLNAYAHQDAPFEKIVDRVSAERDMSMSPIFQVMFVLQNAPSEIKLYQAEKAITDQVASKGELDLAHLNQSYRTSKFDLSLHALEAGEQLQFEIEYCVDLFKRETIERFGGHFLNILSAIAEAPQTGVDTLNILSTEEQNILLLDWNDTAVSLPQDQTFIDLFIEQVLRRPMAIALKYQEHTISYSELDERSNQLAHWIRSSGQKEESLVALFLDRSVDMIIGILGVLKSGAAYVPIDLNYPQDRIEYILDSLACNLILTQDQWQTQLPKREGLEIWCLDQATDKMGDFPRTLPLTSLRPSNLAYTIFTSGSTGKPKGAMVEHLGMLNHLLAKVEAFGMNEDTVMAFTAPYTFDISVWQILSTLITGGQVVVYDDKQIKNPATILSCFQEDQINLLQLVPSYLLALLETLPGKPLSGLTHISVTGEAVSKALLEQWFDRYPSIPVLNAYGPTEASDDVTHYLMHQAPDNIDVPIGKPLRNFKIYIVDKAGQICPIGVPGELWVAGIGVGRGYLNNPEKTAANFIQNPFVKGNERLYKTGDLARWRADGDLEYFGRLDDQVKINGNRIELGEIESALQEMPEVYQNVVVAKKESNGTKFLVAYVVPENEFDREVILDYLKSRLPKFMVPSLIIELAALPLTPNGKVNKKALPAPDTSPMGRENFVAPRNDRETQLAQIWKRFLGVERVGAFDNFFELGGHSLLVMRVIAAMRNEMGYGLEIRDFFVNPNIAALAAYMESEPAGMLLPPVTAIAERPQKTPLSYAQERLWFIDKLNGSTHYHVPYVQGFIRGLNLDALEYAFQQIVNRHELLRSVIKEEDGVAYQEVLPRDSWKLGFQKVAEDISPEELEQLIYQEISRPFDFSTDYMLRAKILDLGQKGFVLVLVMHHIASDAWSNNILINELYELYLSKVEGRSSSLKTLEIQYVDYALWQRNYLTGDLLENKLAYWETQLRGVQPLNLPLDFVRPRIQSSKGDTLAFKFDKTTTQRIHALCQQEGVTLFMFLLTGFKVLLHRYSGQTDICVGTPMANRGQKELEALAGLFINSVALRSDLSGNPAFAKLLSEVKTRTQEAYNHQDTPFEKVVDRIVKERDMGISPIFQVMLILENISNHDSSTEDNVLQTLELPIDHFGLEEAYGEYKNSKFDLTFKVVDGTEEILFNIDYCTDLFRQSTIERMGAHFKTLLSAVIESPNARLSDLEMLSPLETQQLLEVFNDTQYPFPTDKTILDLFLEQVTQTPDKTAIVFEGQELSYVELHERSNQLGHYLRKRGVWPESPVGICIDRSLEMMIGLLGIVKAGGAYLPIDPEYPQERISYMLEDAGITLVLGNQSSKSLLEGLEYILLDEDWQTIGLESKEMPQHNLTPENLFYIIYTSGSTGHPKGVMNQHSGVVNRLLWAQQEYGLDSEVDIVLQKTNFCFDVSVWELFWPIITGVKLVFARPGGHKDSNYLKSLIEKEGITTMHFVPSMLEVFLLDIHAGDCKDLVRVLCSGEALKPVHVKTFLEKLPTVALHNLYGPTEAAIDVTYWQVPGNVAEVPVVPIGKPVANTQLYVLDAYDALVPTGVIGELHIGGIQVARGYWNRPELTAQKFIPNKFMSNPATKLYRTGDLVRWLPDGNIEYLGRKDHQVKMRGYRIELGEIEAVLSNHKLVAQCVVLANEDKNGVKRLVAYIVPAAEFDKAGIQTYLQAHLPEYMVPALMVELQTMPLNANGKIDRKALPDPDASALVSHNTYAAPNTPIETKLVQIWKELLEVDQVGIKDDFFELGGYSLLATRVVSAVKKSMEVEIGTQDIFMYPTIEELAELIGETGKGLALPAIKKMEPRPAKIPLSYAQERLWIIDQLTGSTHYHLPLIQEFAEDTDITMLAFALKEVVNRHEALRTVIRESGEQAYQELLPADNWEADIVQLSDDAGLSDMVSDVIQLPFDLQLDYMLRAKIYHLPNKGYLLVLVLHHIASDGWSLNVLIREALEIYRAKQAGRDVELPILAMQYGDYSVWEREHLNGELLESKLTFWEQQLSGGKPLNLPLDFARPPIQSTRGGAKQFEISAELTSTLNAICREEGVTLFMLLLTAFKVLLHRYSGQDDICVGSPIANRRQKELEDLIGFFANTIALRSDLGGNPSFKALLAQVKAMTLNAYVHQDTPFAKIVERVVDKRDMSISPIFQVMFVLQNAPNEVKIEGENNSASGDTLLKSRTEFSESIGGERASKFDLTLSAIETGEKVLFDLEYGADIFHPDTINRLQQHFTQLLQSIAADIQQPIGCSNLLTQDEQKQLVEDFNATTSVYPKTQSIASLISKQAVSSPKSIALAFEGDTLTYQELEEKSNQFARHLMSNGARPGSIIGICVDRSMEMVIALLGILKSGSAYIPLDPTYPKDRIGYIMVDAQASYLVSTRELASSFDVEDGLKLILLDDDWSGEATTKVSATTGANDLAYIIYTSGSTGRPKGVMIEHQSLVNFLYGMQENFQLGQNSSLLAVTTFSFDIAYLELFLPLLTGAKVVLASSADAIDGLALQQLIRQHRPTHLQATPATWQLLVDSGWRNEEEVVILTGGEAIKESLKTALTKLSDAGVWNMYGPTETTIWSTMQELKADDQVMIGRPIANTQIYILDKQDQLCPIGIAGELCIGGDGLARGYLNRQELTDEKFVINPVSGQGKVYRTGDLARWSSNGQLEYLGRIDDQVKIRGYRIELGEIEAVLNESPHVRQCKVIAREDVNGIQRLVAYIIPEGPFDKTAIRTLLKGKLPEYMVPGLILELAAFPLTPNGKLDKNALPNPTTADFSSHAFVAPESPAEKQMATIWQKLLGLEQIGIYDDFFELGGHSLLATRVVSSVRKELHLDISIRDLFLHSTIKELVLAMEGKAYLSSTPDIQQNASSNQPIPLSYSQERIWFLDKLNGSTEYHMPYVQYFDQELMIPALEHALTTIIDRHSILRTVIREEEGIACQEILDVNNWQLVIEQQGDKSLQSMIEAMIEKPFDLANDYMFRASLINLKEEGHLLLMVAHHIAYDAWSSNILTNELSELYLAKTNGRPPVLQPLTFQYADFARWQRQNLSGTALDKKLTYWEAKLADLSPLNLPVDYPRPKVQSKHGALSNFVIAEALTDELKAICQQEGVTLFMLLLTAFKVLLYKYTGQKDICIGTVTANRDQQELENLIGFFVNTIALRSNLEGNPEFRQLLTAVKETTIDAYSHQDAPFEKVIDRLIEKRDPSRSPLFQVLFVLQNAPDKVQLKAAEKAIAESATTASQLVFDKVEKATLKAKFDLTFQVTEVNGQLKADIEYCADLFKPETIDRMQGHFMKLLGSIAKQPDLRLDAVNILATAERQQLLETFNASEVSYPNEKTALDYFLEQSRHKSDNTALVFGEEVLTYRELNDRSNQLGWFLNKKGIGHDDLVAVCMDRSIDMIISVLATLKTGAAYIPVDPAYPSSRIQYILDDARVPLVITHQNTAETFEKDQTAQLVLFDRDWAEIKQESIDNLKNLPTSDQLAYVVYTSGSTGNPKGVMVQHRALANLIHWHLDVYRVTENSRATLYAGVGFDASIWELWPYLSVGASLTIIHKEQRLSIDLLFDYFVEQGITHSFLPTALIPSFVTISKNRKTALEYLLTGGDALSAVDISDLDYTLVNNYGPSENAVVASYYALSHADIDRTPYIGKPVSNVQLYLLDGDKNLVPVGVEGEIYIGGHSLALGYLNQPELTAEKFITNPFSNHPEAKLYKTGDLARRHPDGNLEFLGRKDDQVKIRGYRIELGEIESVLSECALLFQGVVILWEDTQGEKRLVAYVVSKETFEKEKISHFLETRLPQYMVPSIIINMASLPLTANGKIDKKALPKPDMNEIAGKVYVAPRHEVEKQLATIWIELLTVERVGIYDNFFELGGDSIISIQVVSRAKRYGLELQPKDVFAHQTIAALAKQIAKNANKVDAEQGLLSGHVELLPIQKWFLESGYLSKSHFNQSHLFQIDKSVPGVHLSTVVNAMITHHDALRLKFINQNGHWEQAYEPLNDVFEITAVQGETAAEISENITKTCEGYQASLDIFDGQLIKVVLIQTPDIIAENRLFIVIHHLAVDGVSWRILMGHFRESLRQLHEGKPIDLGQKTSSYRQWVNALNNYCQSDLVESQKSYWQNTGRANRPLPIDKDIVYSAPVLHSEQGLYTVKLQATATRALLLEVNQRYNTEINDILLAALAKTLLDWTQKEKVVIGLEGHGREYITRALDTSNTVGWFTSLYPLCLEINDPSDLGAAIKSVKEQLRNVPNKGIGFGLLRYMHPSTAIRNSLADVKWDILFNYLGQSDNLIESKDLIRSAPEDKGKDIAADYILPNKIEINSLISDGVLRLDWAFSEKHFHAETIEQLAHAYLDNLEALITHCKDKTEKELTPHDLGLTGELTNEEMEALTGHLQEIATEGKDILKF